jgi:hypothetical protein
MWLNIYTLPNVFMFSIIYMLCINILLAFICIKCLSYNVVICLLPGVLNFSYVYKLRD